MDESTLQKIDLKVSDWPIGTTMVDRHVVIPDGILHEIASLIAKRINASSQDLEVTKDETVDTNLVIVKVAIYAQAAFTVKPKK